MKTQYLLSAALFLALGVSTAAPASQDPAEVLEQFHARLSALDAYQVTMTKQQRIDGQLRPVETILLKQRREPRCTYMKWVDKPYKGRELIHCADRYDGKLKVHAGGVRNIATLSLDPHGALAMKDNLHPVTSAGLYMIGRASSGANRGELIRKTVDGRQADCLVSTGTMDVGPYIAGRQELCLDQQSRMPVQMQLWNTDGDMMERYTYRDYRTNRRLSDRDFDVRNRQYAF